MSKHKKQSDNIYGSSGDETIDLNNMDTLAEISVDQMTQCYEKAVKKSMKDPVVFLADCQDEIGGSMGRDWYGDEKIDRLVNENKDNEKITTVTKAFPYDICRQDVPKVFPYLKESFQGNPPRDGFLAVVVTSGGAASFTIPLNQR